MAMKCCIVGCQDRRLPGQKTCGRQQHLQAARARATQGRKKPRKKRREEGEDGKGRGAKKGRRGNKIRGVFSRKWTHNEQLMVRPCGVVIGRATFYQSESVPAVKVSSENVRKRYRETDLPKVFIRSIFPNRYPALLPDFIFFDNACGLRAHIAGCDNELLTHTALVVDPFHFSGHLEFHEECQTYCSPHKYPILKDSEGAWVFNSSVAEQVNSWFGKFQPKVKEMNVVRWVWNFTEHTSNRTQTVTDITSFLMKS